MFTIRSPLARSMSTFALTRLVPAFALALIISGCTVITGPDGAWGFEQRDLTQARRTWSSNFIDDYEYVVRRNCFCTMGGVSVRVIVQNDRVVAREIEGTATPLPSSMAYWYPTIDGLFAILQDAIDRRADRIDATYDYDYGFPTDFYIDYDQRIADEEEGYTLIRFRAL